MQEKPMPSYLEAESGLLGLILWHNSAFDDGAAFVEAEDFYREHHQKIYEAMQYLSQKRDALDPIAVNEVLQRKGVYIIQDLPTLSYLYDLERYEMELLDFEPVTVRAETYARAIAHYAELRRLAGALLQGQQIAYDGAEDAVEQVEALVMAVRKRRQRQDFISIGDYFSTYLKRLDALQADKDGIRGTPTGFDDLDRVTGGLQRGSLYIPAARPGVGKTTLIQNFAYNAATKHHKKIAFFSLEMSLDDLMDRFVAIHTHIDSQRLRTADLTDAEYNLLIGDTLDLFARLGIYITHIPGINTDTLASMVRRMIAKYDIDVIMIDYLQLLKAMTGGKRITPRAEEVAEIARQLKALAGELHVPIVAPAQINREIDKRAAYKLEGEELTYKMPVLSDLRESGELEQSADVVMFLSRSEEKEECVKLDVAKHRNGPTGILDLYFVGSETRFYPMSKGQYAV